LGRFAVQGVMRLVRVLTCLVAGLASGQELLEQGRASYLKGEYARSAELLGKALTDCEQDAVCKENPYEILKALSRTMGVMGRLAEAEEFLQRAIEVRESRGETGAELADDLTEWAMLCRKQKKYERGLERLHRVMSLQHRKAYDSLEGHAALADTFSRMALFHVDQEQPDLAANALGMAVEFRKRVHGENHVALLPELDRLGTVLIAKQRYEDGERVFRHSLRIKEQSMGLSEADLISSLDGLGYVLFGQKKYAEAEPVYLRLLSVWKDSVGKEHPMVSMILDKLALFYREQEGRQEGEAASAEANSIRALFFATGLRREAGVLRGRGDREGAAKLYKDALQVLSVDRAEHAELKTQLENHLRQMRVAERPSPKKSVKGVAAKKAEE